MSDIPSVSTTRAARIWQIVTLQMLSWKARVILVLLALGAVIDWIR